VLATKRAAPRRMPIQNPIAVKLLACLEDTSGEQPEPIAVEIIA
jgi:hypothetical protein